MSNVALLKTSFNAGEVSPMLDGRSDLDKYASACTVLENFIPLTQGPLIKRPGTKFITNCYAGRPWLVKFEFNLLQSFILEFTPNTLRFFFNYGLVLDGFGFPYIVNTPFTADMLTTSQGTFGLSVKQSADVIYIAVANLPPYKLSRISNNNWTLAPLELSNGPFQDQNTDKAHTISVGMSGTPLYHTPGYVTTITSLIDTFTPDMVGTLIKVTPGDIFAGTIDQWQQLTSYPTIPKIVTNDGKYYVLASSSGGTSGYIAPIHTRGTQSDGVLNWYYVGQDATYFKILSYTDSKHVTVTGTTNWVDNLYQSTSFWSLYAWYESTGYPDNVELFRSRLVFSRGQTVWFSKSGDFQNFEAQNFGQIVDNSAITISTSSDGTTAIQNLTSTNIGLICSTDLDQIVVNNATLNQPFSPTNIQVNPGSGIGSRLIDMVRINNDLLFIATSGNRICNLQFDGNTNSFVSPDITVISEHILRPYIVDICWQQNPNSILWMARTDGQLIGMTYNKDQNVTSFHRHDLAGGKVISVESIPNPNMQQDDLWLVVQRVINGVTKNYIEVIQQQYDPVLNPNQWYVDCGLSYSGAATSTISGLDHLAGKEVSVLGDDAYQGPFTVSALGVINLNTPVSNAVVGLPYKSTVQTMRLETQSQEGTSQGSKKRIHRIILRLFHSMGKVQSAPNYLGNEFGKYDEIYFHDMNGSLNQVAPLYTGDKYVDVSSDYSEVGQIAIVHSEPYNFTLICLVINAGIYS